MNVLHPGACVHVGFLEVDVRLDPVLLHPFQELDEHVSMLLEVERQLFWMLQLIFGDPIHQTLNLLRLHKLHLHPLHPLRIRLLQYRFRLLTRALSKLLNHDSLNLQLVSLQLQPLEIVLCGVMSGVGVDDDQLSDVVI